MSMTIEPRNYRPIATVSDADIDTLLDTHPDAFECLLFKAIIGSEEQLTPDVTDYAGSLESTKVGISYADPIKTKAFMLPEEGFRLPALMDGSDADYYDNEGQQPIVLLIKEKDVPQQSVIRWREAADDANAEPRTITMYILRSDSMGRSPSVSKMRHYCIPFPASGEIE